MSVMGRSPEKLIVSVDSYGVPFAVRRPDDPPNTALKEREREYVRADLHAGAVEALQAVENYFRRPLGDATEAEAADRLDAVLAKVHAALGGQ